MTKEDRQIIDRAVKGNWRIGDRTRLKHLLEKNLKLYRENKTLEGCLLAEQEHTQMLEQQIEKMKCCGNCSHYKKDNNNLYPIIRCEYEYPNRCENKNKWEIKENGD